MSTIFGAIAENDHERAFVRTAGQELVFDVAQRWIADRNAELAMSISVFVEMTTEAFKERYKKVGGGYLQRRGAQSQAGAVKSYGSWDVAYPLEDFSAAISWNDVDIAYMSAQELSLHIESIMDMNRNTLRWEILHRLFDNVQGSFTDPIHGSLSIEPLANGDTVTYQPVNGSITEATEDHYLESGYAATLISDTNNPLETIRKDLSHHNPVMTGGKDIVVFHNNAQRTQLSDLTDYDPVVDNFIQPGDNADIPFGWPQVPGEVHGRASGVWTVEWDFVPANYLLAVDMDEPAPLKMRVDPADTGLGQGLSLVATDERFPFTNSFWRHRFGIGAGNRLNGVAMELGDGGTYTVPTAYD
jgi:hypothetical protein